MKPEPLAAGSAAATLATTEGLLPETYESWWMSTIVVA